MKFLSHSFFSFFLSFRSCRALGPLCWQKRRDAPWLQRDTLFPRSCLYPNLRRRPWKRSAGKSRIRCGGGLPFWPRLFSACCDMKTNLIPCHNFCLADFCSGKSKEEKRICGCPREKVSFWTKVGMGGWTGSPLCGTPPTQAAHYTACAP